MPAAQKSAGVLDRKELAKYKAQRKGSQENGSPVSAISPCVGEVSSQLQGWKVISL
jgi:hypothetical protein